MSRDDDDDDRPRRRRRDEDDDDRPRRRARPDSLTGLDALFVNTNIVMLVLFGFCCGGIALILGIVGLVTCQDERAKQRALLVTIIGGVMAVIGFIAGVMQAFMKN